MVKLKVLIEGYAREDKNGEQASCSTTLLQENGLNIVVDPGMDRALLLEHLKKEGLTTNDIDYVVLTHTHLDHCFLVGIFENAKVLDGDSIYSSDGRIASHDGKVPGTDIEIVKTPGHDQFHCSVLAKTEEFGKVIVSGDVFWWRNGEVQETNENDLIHRIDPYMKDEPQLIESRKLILKTADYIIPGHGKMFKVKR
jgi:glyoxylase-like metal-dependent hydrolase (beta-lactamase superfamily II)